MKSILLVSALFSLFTFKTLAHEGHNHGPGQVQPTKGGVIQKADKFFMEVVGSNKEVKFYPLAQADKKSLMLKPIALGEFKLSATMSLPRAKKSEVISLKPAGDHFVGIIDAKNSHRYEVKATIEYKGEKEELTYQIEPQE